MQTSLSGNGAPILRSAEIREGGKVVMGNGAKPRTVVSMHKAQRGSVNGHIEDIIKAPHLSRNTSAREIRQKLGVVEDLMSLQGIRRA